MTGILKCRICGKEYEACRSAKRSGVFHWQSVACCVEHGAEYLALIRASRAETEAPEKPVPVEVSVEEAFALLDAEYDEVEVEDEDLDESDDDIEIEV